MENSANEPVKPSERREKTMFFLLLGLIFIGAGLWVEAETIQFRAKAQRATGVVYDFQIERRLDDDYPYDEDISHYPWVQFYDANNQEYRFRGLYGPSKPLYKKNDRVPVLYDPARPLTARIDSEHELKLPSTILFILAVITLFIALYEWFQKDKPFFRRPRLNKAPSKALVDKAD
jgi:Protein of unknown function (DUF3592)